MLESETEIRKVCRGFNMSTIKIQVRRKGTITLPRELRNRYNVAEGDVFTVVDLGDGSLLLMPGASQVARLADRVAKALEAEEVSLDELLDALDEEREAYYAERYSDTPPLSR
jgi:AbrB family looped-hinge helix DNA binding protein